MPDDGLVTVLVPVHEYEPAFLHAAIESLVQQTAASWRALVIVEPRDGSGSQASWHASLPTRGLCCSPTRDGTSPVPSTPGCVTRRHRSSPSCWPTTCGRRTRSRCSSRTSARARGRLLPFGRRIVDADGSSISSIHGARPDVTLPDFETTAPVKHLLCWRRALGLAAGGMDERSRSVGPDDLDFPWVMAENGAVFGSLDECLYVYRDHRDHFRLTTHLPRSVQRRELARIFRKHGLSRSLARKRIRPQRDRISASACTARRWSNASEMRWACHPGNPGESVIADIPQRDRHRADLQPRHGGPRRRQRRRADLRSVGAPRGRRCLRRRRRGTARRAM